MILDNIWYVAAIWMDLAFVASLIAIRTGISVALVEIVVGVVVGNLAFAGGHYILQTTEWTNFLAMLGSGVLTLLAGAADDYFKDRQKEVAELAAQHGLSIACETRRGHPAKNILQMAKEGGYGLIVVGHSDHSELWGRLLGDTADRITDHAQCSVLVVKTDVSSPKQP